MNKSDLIISQFHVWGSAAHRAIKHILLLVAPDKDVRDLRNDIVAGMKDKNPLWNLATICGPRYARGKHQFPVDHYSAATCAVLSPAANPVPAPGNRIMPRVLIDSSTQRGGIVFTLAKFHSMLRGFWRAEFSIASIVRIAPPEGSTEIFTHPSMLQGFLAFFLIRIILPYFLGDFNGWRR